MRQGHPLILFVVPSTLSLESLYWNEAIETPSPNLHLNCLEPLRSSHLIFFFFFFFLYMLAPVSIRAKRLIHAEIAPNLQFHYSCQRSMGQPRNQGIPMRENTTDLSSYSFSWALLLLVDNSTLLIPRLFIHCSLYEGGLDMHVCLHRKFAAKKNK